MVDVLRDSLLSEKSLPNKAMVCEAEDDGIKAQSEDDFGNSLPYAPPRANVQGNTYL